MEMGSSRVRLRMHMRVGLLIFWTSSPFLWLAQRLVVSRILVAHVQSLRPLMLQLEPPGKTIETATDSDSPGFITSQHGTKNHPCSLHFQVVLHLSAVLPFCWEENLLVMRWPRCNKFQPHRCQHDLEERPVDVGDLHHLQGRKLRCSYLLVPLGTSKVNTRKRHLKPSSSKSACIGYSYNAYVYIYTCVYIYIYVSLDRFVHSFFIYLHMYSGGSKNYHTNI